MQEQNKFEDLVLQNDSKKNKQRQIIFKIIIFVIVFLIAAIIYKLVANTSDQKQPLPPMEANAEFVSKADENEVFENIKSENEGFSDDFASLEERLKKENNIVDDKPKESNIVKELADVKPVIEEKPIVKVEEKPVVETKPEVKPAVKVEPKPEVKQEVKVATPKSSENSVFDTIDVKKPVQNVAKPSVSTDGGVYIQVYAGKNIDLKSHEIKKLDTLGLQYKVVTDGSGLSRVIVGPYTQANKADAIKFVRENVRKDAFFYRGK